MPRFEAAVGAGSLRSTTAGAVGFPHRWTADGVTVETEFTGAHLLHLSAAGCVLNDLYREAAELGLHLDGVRVTAFGDFDTQTWSSTGITYTVEVDSPEHQDDLVALVLRVDEVAEIPRAIRAGAPVKRG